MSKVKEFLSENKNTFFGLAAAVLYLYGRWYLFIMEKLAMDDRKDIWLFASFVVCAALVQLVKKPVVAAPAVLLLCVPVCVFFPEFAFAYFPVVWLALLGSAFAAPQKRRNKKGSSKAYGMVAAGFLPVVAAFVFGIVQNARLWLQGNRNTEEKENLFFIQMLLLVLLSLFYAGMAFAGLARRQPQNKKTAGNAPLPPVLLPVLCRGAAFFLLAVVLVYGFLFRRATFFEMQFIAWGWLAVQWYRAGDSLLQAHVKRMHSGSDCFFRDSAQEA